MQIMNRNNPHYSVLAIVGVPAMQPIMRRTPPFTSCEVKESHSPANWQWTASPGSGRGWALIQTVAVKHVSPTSLKRHPTSGQAISPPVKTMYCVRKVVISKPQGLLLCY